MPECILAPILKWSITYKPYFTHTDNTNFETHNTSLPFRDHSDKYSQITMWHLDHFCTENSTTISSEDTSHVKLLLNKYHLDMKDNGLQFVFLNICMEKQ